MWCLGLVAKDMVKLSKSNKLKFRSRILPYKKFNVELLQFGRYGPPYPPPVNEYPSARSSHQPILTVLFSVLLFFLF